jgi:hypothetical protein
MLGDHPCVDCGKPQKRYRCLDCVCLWLRDQNFPDAQSQMQANYYKLTAYYATCPDHGRVLHRVDTNICQTCEPPRSDSARAIARRARLTTYEDKCEKHGVTVHEVGSGRCRECFPLRGAAKAPRSQARIDARKSGRPTYWSYCPVHVEADHSTATGECLACVADMRAAQAVAIPPRVLARRAGDVTYADACEIHGPAALHHVNTGKCLTCFTATGARRVRG